MTVQMTYTGPTGDVNYDVSRETGGPARMEKGAKYTVSEDLARSLVLSAVWKAPKSRETELLKAAEEEAEESPEPEESEQQEDNSTGGSE